jgi:2-amino-4-hydroxy-6-hydroxymethyldihydropteridine diphosphokinase
MQALLRIETEHGRARDPADRCAPRILDLDILLLGRDGEVVHEDPMLTVPHPRLHERAFALAPLLDIQPDLAHPVLRRPLRDLLVAALLWQPAPVVPPLSEGLLSGPCVRR